MSELAVKILRSVSSMLQLIGVAYLTLIAWLTSTWMVDDGWAARAGDADWWMLAVTRAGLGVLAAAVAGGSLLVLNHGLARWRLGFAGLRPVPVAWMGAGAIGAASVIGAIYFAVERPFM